MTAEAERGNRRACAWCGKRIYYGLYCSNDCSAAAYRKWYRDNLEATS